MANELAIGNAGGLKKFTEREDVKEAIQKAFPCKMHVGQFMLGAMLSAQKVPSLYNCSPASWMASMLQSAQIGLIPDGRHGSLVPYQGEVTFQPMYQGLEALAWRSEKILTINTQLVYKGEDFWIKDIGGEVAYAHVMDLPKRNGNPDNVTGAYFACVFVDDAGKERSYMEFMHKDELEKIRHDSLSKAKNPTNPKLPWNAHVCEMYRKTVSKRAWKRIPKDDTMAMAATMLQDLDHDPIEDAIEIDAVDVTPKTTADRTKEIVDRAVAARETAPDPTPSEHGNKSETQSTPTTESTPEKKQPPPSPEKNSTKPATDSVDAIPDDEPPPQRSGPTQAPKPAPEPVTLDGAVLSDNEQVEFFDE